MTNALSLLTEEDLHEHVSRLMSEFIHAVEHATTRRFWVSYRVSNKERTINFTVSVTALTERHAYQKALVIVKRTFEEAGSTDGSYTWSHTSTVELRPIPLSFTEGQVMKVRLFHDTEDCCYLLYDLSLEKALSFDVAALPYTKGAEVTKYNEDRSISWRGHVVDSSGRIERRRPNI